MAVLKQALSKMFKNLITFGFYKRKIASLLKNMAHTPLKVQSQKISSAENERTFWFFFLNCAGKREVQLYQQTNRGNFRSSLSAKVTGTLLKQEQCGIELLLMSRCCDSGNDQNGFFLKFCINGKKLR